MINITFYSLNLVISLALKIAVLVGSPSSIINNLTMNGDYEE